EKFLEIAAHGGRIGGLRGTEIDQQHADLAGCGRGTIGRRGGRWRGGEGFVHRDAAYVMAAGPACVLSTQPHPVASGPRFLAMSAIPRFAPGLFRSPTPSPPPPCARPPRSTS